MADKSKSQRRTGVSREQTDDNSRDAPQSVKSGSTSKNIEGWLRSKELQPPS